MREVSIFVDESGDSSTSKHYLLTLVVHDQADALDSHIERYIGHLRNQGLSDIPFHASPLMNGHDEYEGMPMKTRKALLASFSGFVRSIPVSYATFRYRRGDVPDGRKLERAMSEDIAEFTMKRLAFFQEFDLVKIYYDDGQGAVTRALRSAIGDTISKQAAVYRGTRFERFRLAQVADYLCAIELAAVKYAAGEQTRTDELFFGSSTQFKKNWLKQARRKLLA